MVMFASVGQHPHGAKDSAHLAIAAKAFVVNVATWHLRHAMNASSETLPRGTDEFRVAGLTAVDAVTVDAPRVKEAPVALECRLVTAVALPSTGDGPNVVVFGEVTGIHIADSVLTEGFVDIAKLKPIARLGYKEYALVTDSFVMDRPGDGDRLVGMG